MSKNRFTGEEAMARFDAALKKALNVTGPRVTVVPTGKSSFYLDIDFDDIVKRGKDCAP
jgi:Fe-S cluster assembly iron-binding protein IscA